MRLFLDIHWGTGNGIICQPLSNMSEIARQEFRRELETADSVVTGTMISLQICNAARSGSITCLCN
jgi:hypothetical protein